MKKQSKYSIYDTHDGNHDCPAAIFFIDLMSMLSHLVFNEAGGTSSIIIDLKMANCWTEHPKLCFHKDLRLSYFAMLDGAFQTCSNVGIYIALSQGSPPILLRNVGRSIPNFAFIKIAAKTFVYCFLYHFFTFPSFYFISPKSTS